MACLGGYCHPHYRVPVWGGLGVLYCRHEYTCRVVEVSREVPWNLLELGRPWLLPQQWHVLHHQVLECPKLGLCCCSTYLCHKLIGVHGACLHHSWGHSQGVLRPLAL